MIKKSLLFLLIACGGILAGLFVMISGVFPIKASSGHWEVTKMILQYSMSRSVSFYSHFVPEEKMTLSEAAHLERAKGHYEIGCRVCHGIPGVDGKFIGAHTTAEAPYLPPSVSKWTAKELFTIVKDGVKFTGMPHWPDLHRDDEVWSMVKFLQKLPSMKHEEFATTMKLQSCHQCHHAKAQFVPHLDGQSEAYLRRSLMEYKSKERFSGTMHLVASVLSEKQINDYAAHFTSKKISSPEKMINDPDLFRRGEMIAEKGIPQKRIAACTGCHGPHWSKKGKNPEYPRLIGLQAQYINLELQLFQDKKRGKGEFVRVMEKALGEHLSAEEREAVSYYYDHVPKPVEVQE